MAKTTTKLNEYSSDFKYVGLKNTTFYLRFQDNIYGYADLIRPVGTTSYVIKITDNDNKTYRCQLVTTDLTLYVPETYLQTHYNKKKGIDDRTEYELIT